MSEEVIYVDNCRFQGERAAVSVLHHGHGVKVYIANLKVNGALHTGAVFLDQAQADTLVEQLLDAGFGIPSEPVDDDCLLAMAVEQGLTDLEERVDAIEAQGIDDGRAILGALAGPSTAQRVAAIEFRQEGVDEDLDAFEARIDALENTQRIVIDTTSTCDKILAGHIDDLRSRVAALEALA